MPPKAARGAPARGRGRGRGRGALAVPVPQGSVVAVPEATERESESQSTITDSPMIDGEPAGNTTPEQNDPNSSPATQPTETPAPTPARPPPITRSSEGTLPIAGPDSKGAAKKPSKFKPKNVRRTQEEREELEAREREKEQLKLNAAAAAASRGRGAWGRGRGGRGRGDAMGGRGRGMQGVAVASGPFSQAPETAGKRPGLFGPGMGLKRESGPSYSKGGGSGGGGGGGGGGSGSGIKTEGGSSTYVGGGNYDATVGRFIPEPQYPDDDEAPRVDIEHINLISDDDDDDLVITSSRFVNKGKGKAGPNKGGLRPIRLDRKEHKDRVIIVNTVPSTKTHHQDANGDSDAIMMDENSSSHVSPIVKREWKGTYEDDVEVQFKLEPGIDIDMDNVAAHPASSPTAPKSKNPLAESDADEPEIIKPEVSPRKERRAKPRRHSTKKDMKPVIQTEEDRKEWERRLHDMELLRKELGGMRSNLSGKEKAKDAEGDVQMEAAEEPEFDQREGRLYLFQFPRILPKVYDPVTSSNPNITKGSITEEVEISGSKQNIDLTKDPKVKSEVEEVVVKKEEEESDSATRKNEADFAEADGLMGKLILHKSGKAELTWGGTNMNLKPGTNTSFWSAGAMVDGLHFWGNKDENGKEILPQHGSKGKTTAMGKIMGKFVVTPNQDFIR